MGLDKAKAEQEVSWLAARLREPSTYAGLGLLLGALGISHANEWAVSLTSIGLGVGGVLAILLPEAKKAVSAIVIGAMLLGAPTVRAADMPVKAPKLSVKSCAPYLGINAMGAGSALNVNGGVVGSAPFGTVAVQGDLGLTLGEFCQLAPGKFFFVEGMFDWASLNGASAGFSISGPAHFEQRFGVSAGALGDYLPSFFNLSAPGITNLLPQGAVAGSPQLYAFASAHEQDISVNFGDANGRDWAFYPGVGLGTLTVVTATDGSKTTWDTFAEATFSQSAFCVGGRGCGALGVGARVGFSIKN